MKRLAFVFIVACGDDGSSVLPDSTTAGSADAPPAVESLFRADFDDLNEVAPNQYNFANRYAQSTSTWETAHLPSGGWNNSGAAHIAIHGCEPGPQCNTSEHQFNSGWVTPALNHTFAMGDELFVRMRIKFDPDTQFALETFGAKFILVGSTGTTPNSRWIIHLMPAMRNQGCTLGFDYSYTSWDPPSTMWHDYRDWGFAENFDQGIAGLYASFQSNVNISWSCNPGVLVTRSNHATPVPKPQNFGASPVDGWYHIQFQAISGGDGQSGFRTWINNNERLQPSSERLNLPEGLGVQGWSNGVDVGGYWGTEFQGTLGYIIDDVEIGTTFDPNWAQ